MTAQNTDYFKYEGQDYRLVALSKKIGFNPRKYGLRPYPRTTACWEGYWCDYEILDNKLLLKNLYIYNKKNKYPQFLGTMVSPVTYHEVKCYYTKDGESVCEIQQAQDFDGHRLYKDVGLEISYTGKILVGSGFIRDYYIHMGYQMSWAYEKLLEFSFEEGFLKEVKDCSKDAEAQRDALDNGEPLPGTNANMYAEDGILVVDNFSLEYKDKAWWLL